MLDCAKLAAAADNPARTQEMAKARGRLRAVMLELIGIR
jgi:hypothetical protein